MNEITVPTLEVISARIATTTAVLAGLPIWQTPPPTATLGRGGNLKLPPSTIEQLFTALMSEFGYGARPEQRPNLRPLLDALNTDCDEQEQDVVLAGCFYIPDSQLSIEHVAMILQFEIVRMHVRRILVDQQLVDPNAINWQTPLGRLGTNRFACALLHTQLRSAFGLPDQTALIGSDATLEASVHEIWTALRQAPE